LPPFWEPFSSFGFAMLMACLLPGLLAGLFGYLAFRSRIRGVYFSILTQALTYGACLLFFRNSLLMGGNNGFTDFKFILGYDLRDPATQRGLYIITAIAVVLIYAGCRWLSTTKFGLVQQAIRDRENRVLFSGYAAGNYKLFVFVLAALIASVGGILYVPQVGIINPSEMATDKSLEAVVWVAVGGRGTLLGPILGAFGVNAMKSWATRAYPDLWLLFLGGLFVLVTLFMPKGIVGLPEQLRALWQRFTRKPVKEAVAAPQDGATMMFYKERQAGKHHDEATGKAPTPSAPDSTPPAP
jgi:urea transport system permease protein